MWSDPAPGQRGESAKVRGRVEETRLGRQENRVPRAGARGPEVTVRLLSDAGMTEAHLSS